MKRTGLEGNDCASVPKLATAQASASQPGMDENFTRVSWFGAELRDGQR
jgi:hypothetical protein